MQRTGGHDIQNTGEEFVIGGRYHSPEIAGEITAKLLDLSDPPTAIMYPDDFSYLGGVAEIRNRGLCLCACRWFQGNA